MSNSFYGDSDVNSRSSSRRAAQRDEFSKLLNLQPIKPVDLKVIDGRVVLIFPTQNQQDDDWQALIQRLNQKLSTPYKDWESEAKVDLVVGNRLLDGRQLLLVSKLLANAKLILDCIHTARRQTAMAAVSAGYSVQQSSPEESLAQFQSEPDAKLPVAVVSQVPGEPLVLTKTIRSGSEIKHPGLIIVLGDVNPGGTVIADGDIMIWGSLRGIAHAGACGDKNACIMALKMQPTQLRIADKVARAPANQLEEFYPEVAHIAADGIRITRAYDFSRLN